MKPVSIAIACFGLFGLAACGTPAERCQASVSSEERAVTRLLGEVNENLARGYAWENEVRGGTGFSFCAGGYRSGRVGLGYGSCYGGPDTVRTRVPIDPAAELRKRDALQKRLAGLQAGGQAACIARYGTTPQM
ncbi:hypothetical protein [Paracoccus laeviglucosivorans]|uniref:Uncharacterized protein n=1 Tax=Paracoccus laeviglucosivorans TaxID=1197861 RepID=A0A521E9J0_9RHOB|nr:hypothetical protein [Paracoccus laeviglucosivorans]SMO80583.1 hypothetical protein SAMN06265221_11233 [Paracoccus laeviglucosivorans]